MTTIKLDIEFSSLGETTEALAKVFAAEIQQRIESEYPDASVNVGIDIRGFGGLSVIADSCEEQDEIIEQVNYIKRDVWENGDWHNAA
ncbi:DinI-like family protein [Salmonella enterica subsp. enterica serovar Berta]|nr:DinI-like family protein [Salmonella enterica subsp. enterica serovar Berta]